MRYESPSWEHSTRKPAQMELAPVSGLSPALGAAFGVRLRLARLAGTVSPGDFGACLFTIGTSAVRSVHSLVGAGSGLVYTSPLEPTPSVEPDMILSLGQTHGHCTISMSALNSKEGRMSMAQRLAPEYRRSTVLLAIVFCAASLARMATAAPSNT